MLKVLDEIDSYKLYYDMLLAKNNWQLKDLVKDYPELDYDVNSRARAVCSKCFEENYTSFLDGLKFLLVGKVLN